MSDFNNYHQALVDYGIATNEEVALVTSINGNNLESYESILYTRTAWRSFITMARL